MSELVPLSSMAHVNPTSPRVARGRPVSFVGMADVDEQGFISEWHPSVGRSGYTPFRSGDTLVAKITPCFENGKGALVPGRELLFEGSTEFHVLRAKDDVDPRYLHYLTRTEEFRLRGEANMSGSAGQQRVPTDFFDRYSARRPPLEEQRRIAEVLDSVDDAIRSTERLIAKLTACEVSLVSQAIESARSVDLPLERVVLSAVDGPFGSSLKTEHYVDVPGVRVVRLGNIGRGVFLECDEAYVSAEHARTLQRHRVEAGDVLVASLGDENHPPGRSTTYPKHLDPGIVKADCFRLRTDPEVAKPEVLSLALNDELNSRRLSAVAQGVTRDRINLGNLLQVVIRLPVPADQEKLDSAVTTVRKQRRLAIQSASTLKALRSGLADDLLSGRVRTVEG